MSKCLGSYLRMLSVILALCFLGSLNSLLFATDYDDFDSLREDPYTLFIDYSILDDEHVRFDRCPHYDHLIHKRYAEAVDSGRSYIEERLQKKSSVLLLHKPLVLYAFALEMNGDFEEAIAWYSMLYPDPGMELSWAVIRMAKRTEDGISTTFCYLDKKNLFSRICMTIEENYPLTVDDVDRTIDKITQIQKLAKSPESLHPALLKGLDIYRTKSIDGCYGHPGLNDRVACSLYTLRDRCARVICPELHYVHVGRGEYIRSEQILLARKSYREFLAFMEEEYAKILKQKEAGKLKGVRPEKFELYEDVMQLLRKMTELPY